MVVCEQEGDRITHDIIQRLNQTFVTPFDREDIIALASGLDDIVDFIEEVADFLGLYRIEAPMEQAQRMARVLHEATRQINEAIPRLRTLKDIHHYTVEVNRLENEGDRILREAVASLFDHGIDPMMVIRWKDIFERLEDAIDATETAVNIMAGHHHQEPVAVHSDVVLWIVVATALAFDFTNGFHDTANSIATSVSTRAMSPEGGRDHGRRAELRRRVPVAGGGRDDRQGDRRLDHDHAADRVRRADRRDRLEPRDVVARAAVVVLARADRRDGRRDDRLRGRRRRAVGRADREGRRARRSSRPCWRWSPPGSRSSSPTGSSGASRRASSRAASGSASAASSALFSLSHGTNDAQKTMGIIFLALVANGNLSADADIPTWVVVSSASAIALGTYFGGWRIVRTMGSKIIKMDPAQGFAAQGAGAAVILSASHVGFPLSTTQVMSGAIMGAGAAKRLSAVRWGVAGQHRRWRGS